VDLDIKRKRTEKTEDIEEALLHCFAQARSRHLPANMWTSADGESNAAGLRSWHFRISRQQLGG